MSRDRLASRPTLIVPSDPLLTDSDLTHCATRSSCRAVYAAPDHTHRNQQTGMNRKQMCVESINGSLVSPFFFPTSIAQHMSSCVVSGFFDIATRRRFRQDRFGLPQAQTILYGHYRSTISGTMDSLGLVYIRPPAPAWNNDVPNHAVVYLIGTLFAQTGSHPSLIETTHMDVVHASPIRHRCRMPFPPCYVDAVGVVVSEQYYLSPAFLALPITVSQTVWDGVRTFGLTYVLPLLAPSPCPDHITRCLIPHHDFITEYPRLPPVGSFVHMNGYFSRVLPSGEFAVEVDDLNFTFPFGSLAADNHVDNDATD